MAADPRDGNIVYSPPARACFASISTPNRARHLALAGQFRRPRRRDFPHRFQWTEPILFSPHDPNVIYTAGEVVFKTTNQGQELDRHQPRPDPQRQVQAARPPAAHHRGQHQRGIL
jgi:hypothetical protein